MSSTFFPVLANSFETAKTGPMPISSGSHPATAKPRKMPIGFKPRLAASLSLMTAHAAAPSENWLALPAATTPPGNAGLICATPAYVVSGRMPSSIASVTSFVYTRDDSLSATPIVTVIGTISSLNFPAACAAAARCWLCAPYSSCLSREI